MGFLLKFILFFAIIYMIFNFLGRLLFGARRKSEANRYRQQQTKPKTPESQDERILDYQKRNFEASDAEDVDFEEIKQKD